MAKRILKDKKGVYVGVKGSSSSSTKKKRTTQNKESLREGMREQVQG